MPNTLPRTLPYADPTPSGAVGANTPDVDTGGYDLTLGGFGFRLATDQQNPYTRQSEPTTNRRFDSSLEPGEQTLNTLPWIKSQSSFHAGAGQLNLEQGFTAFQYQQEQVEHIRYDTSLGIDPWTPGILRRLPDCTLTTLSPAAKVAVTGSDGAFDYAVVGGATGLYQLKWAAGPDAAPTATNIDLTGAMFGGQANCTVSSICTDGSSYYAILQLAVAQATYAGVKTLIIKGGLTAITAPTVIYNTAATSNTYGVIGWAKERPMLGFGPAVYELNPAASVGSSLPTAKYTHPAATRSWVAISESPDSILIAGNTGFQSSIQSLTLDTAGAAPTLSGGSTVANLPTGEQITSLATVGGSSFLAIGTTLGIRIATFDTYTGALKYGPLNTDANLPVTTMTGRDRFVYYGFDNQQADGTTGLACIDLSMITDQAGRYAWAPSLRPPAGAATGLGKVSFTGVLPMANRIVFMSPDGVHVEGGTPGVSGAAWMRTSRIRYDTSEMKLFTLGRIQGALDVGTIQVTGICPFQADTTLGSFGFIATGDPGEFNLPTGVHEWLQLKFTLTGAAAVLNSYQAKAIPAPKRQHIITFTLNCFREEMDRNGYSVTDPVTPRQRLQNLTDLEGKGDECRLVEFTPTGPVAQLVVIEDLAFQQDTRPTQLDDIGGYITLKLRATRS